MSKLFSGAASLIAGTVNLVATWPEPMSALLSGWCYGMATILLISLIVEMFIAEESQ